MDRSIKNRAKLNNINSSPTATERTPLIPQEDSEVISPEVSTSEIIRYVYKCIS